MHTELLQLYSFISCLINLQSVPHGGYQIHNFKTFSLGAARVGGENMKCPFLKSVVIDYQYNLNKRLASVKKEESYCECRKEECPYYSKAESSGKEYCRHP